jgi:hypothetical protein
MPFQPALPTWLAVNNMNSPYQSGQGDSVTGFPYNAGGLNLGDYFDLTNDEAFNASYATNGILYYGRYRYVLVDSGATAANVKAGTIGYARIGSSVSKVVVLTQGTGQTVGTYQIAASGGGGTGAVIQVVVTAANAITVTVLQGGTGYTSVPTFTLATGGTPGTVVAQMGTTANVVTSFDVGVTANTAVRPVVFLNSITPGNYGFIQELGVATVLANAALTSATANAWVNAKTSGAGTVDTTAASGSPIGSTIGQAIDMPYASVLFKCLLDGPIVQD